MKPIESLKRNFHAVSGCFTPEQNAINRLIFTCSHRKESLQERIFCDLLEMFTSVKANNMNNKILSSLQSLVWISNVSLGKKWAGLVPCIVTSSSCTALCLERCLSNACLCCFRNVASQSCLSTVGLFLFPAGISWGHLLPCHVLWFSGRPRVHF